MRPLEFLYHNIDVTIRAYIMNGPMGNYLTTSEMIYRKLLEKVNDRDYVNAIIKRFGRALDPVLVPQVIELGGRLGYDVRSIIQLAARKDPEYLKLLSRVIIGEE